MQCRLCSSITVQFVDKQGKMSGFAGCHYFAALLALFIVVKHGNGAEKEICICQLDSHT